MAKIYKETTEYEPMVEVGEREQEFIADFQMDCPAPINYRVDGDMLDETVASWMEQDKDPPEELVKFLREQVKGNGEFYFIVE